MSRDGKSAARGRIRNAIANTAPRIAGALGGPLAASAVTALSRAIFGNEYTGEAALGAALENMSADQIVALKHAELEFEAALAAAAVEEARIAAGDRASARARQQGLRDIAPTVLGGLIVGGFFAVLGAMVTRRLPTGAESEFSIMLGALATMTAAVVNYYFGSSAGSKEKTRLIASARAFAEEE